MTPLFYKDIGQGKPVVLLHGFLETHLIWEHFAQALSKNYRVITIDLPGFGQSQLPTKNPFSLAEIATQLNAFLQGLTAEKISIIGHSLGGYVSLAMVEQAPELFSSFCLFHSTALADSVEKKEGRTKTIAFVQRNGALAFSANFIPPLFADPEHESIPFVRELAMQTSQRTITSYLEAMRDRPDSMAVLQSYKGAILFLAGSKDSVIPLESLKAQVEQSNNAFLEVFEGVGHMGMFEAPKETLEIVVNFLKARG